MKVWRALIANLLVVLLLTTGGGVGFIFAQTSSAAAREEDDEAKITAEEAQDAREFAERFMRRMLETNNLAPLLGEMFVQDYAVRLRQESSNKPLALLSKNAVREASGEELVRYQLALNHSLYLTSLLFLAHITAHATGEEEEDDEDAAGAATLQQAIPPDIIELCKRDPILKALFEEEAAAEREEETQASEAGEKSNIKDEDVERIKTAEQLRNFTSTLEQAIALARKHLAAASLKLTLLDRHKGANEEENWKAEREALKPRAWTLAQEFYGYPKGTRIFCVNAFVYHMDLIRVDGKLKVLALYFDMD
jgi:hypothetical protein